MAGGIAIVVAGALIAAIGAAIGLNARGLGHQVGTLGGAIAFWFDGGQALRHRQRMWRLVGAALLVIGLGWAVGGIARLT